MGVPIDPIRREAVKSQATLEKGAPRSGGGKTDGIPVLSIQAVNEENEKHAIGPHPPECREGAGAKRRRVGSSVVLRRK